MGRDAEGVCAVGKKAVDGEVEEAKLKERRHGVQVFTWLGGGDFGNGPSCVFVIVVL